MLVNGLKKWREHGILPDRHILSSMYPINVYVTSAHFPFLPHRDDISWKRERQDDELVFPLPCFNPFAQRGIRMPLQDRETHGESAFLDVEQNFKENHALLTTFYLRFYTKILLLFLKNLFFKIQLF